MHIALQVFSTIKYLLLERFSVRVLLSTLCYTLTLHLLVHFSSITAHIVRILHNHQCKADTQAPLKCLSLENENQSYFHCQIPAYDLFVLLWDHLCLLLTRVKVAQGKPLASPLGFLSCVQIKMNYMHICTLLSRFLQTSQPEA